MRILHTGDWHLGKHLGPYARLAEQADFLDELVGIVETQAVDLVLVAGDVYDTFVPSAAAEQLFYDAMLRLSRLGKKPVPVVVIAGNHDSPERLSASAPLSAVCGVLIVGGFEQAVQPGRYDHFEIPDAGDGYFEIAIGGERAVIATVPYPSERRLNWLLDDDRQGSYSAKIGRLMEKAASHFRADTVNILTGHFYVAGGILSKDSERAVQLGGAYAVDATALPAAAQYIALGHLHRPQAVGGHACAYYAGSPLQYAASETGYAKCVIRADVQPGRPAAVEKVYLRNGKPIALWEANSVEEALALTRHSKDPCWVFLTIKTDKPLTQSVIKQLRANKPDIVEIVPVLPTAAVTIQALVPERDMADLFAAFYREKRNAPPSKALISLFLTLSTEG